MAVKLVQEEALLWLYEIVLDVVLDGSKACTRGISSVAVSRCARRSFILHNVKIFKYYLLSNLFYF